MFLYIARSIVVASRQAKNSLDSGLFDSKRAKSLYFLPSSHTHTDDNTGEVAEL